MIPRSPIRELIEQQFQPWLSIHPNRILDLCCGSGCLGILAALNYNFAKVDLADLSEQALELANKNITKFDLSTKVATHQGDLFGAIGSQQYDLIISNPPYVDADDLASMPKHQQSPPWH